MTSKLIQILMINDNFDWMCNLKQRTFLIIGFSLNDSFKLYRKNEIKQYLCQLHGFVSSYDSKLVEKCYFNVFRLDVFGFFLEKMIQIDLFCQNIFFGFLWMNWNDSKIWSFLRKIGFWFFVLSCFSSLKTFSLFLFHLSRRKEENSTYEEKCLECLTNELLLGTILIQTIRPCFIFSNDHYVHFSLLDLLIFYNLLGKMITWWKDCYIFYKDFQ